MKQARSIVFRVIILDFDGVVIESVDIKTDAFRELFRDRPKVLDQILTYHLQNNGISRLIKLRYIYEHVLGVPYDKKTEQEVTEHFSALVFERVVRCPYVPGAVDFLHHYSKLCSIYLASSSPEAELRRIVSAREISHFFRGIFGAPRSKEEAFRELLAGERVSSRDAVFIGDSIEDYRVARKTGVRFVARQNKESFADLSVPVFPDLATIHRFLAFEFGRGAYE